MSSLKKRIHDTKTVKQELIASTVRLPKQLHLFIEELAEQLSLSRQEMMLMLIEEGVGIAEKELDSIPDDIEGQKNSNFHILNTNKRSCDEDQEKMLREGIAAAFYGDWKTNINRIKKGDVVFLYENRVGIIAYGIGTGQTLVRDYDGDKDETHYQKLEDFTILEQPLTASEIKQILGRKIPFTRTMSAISDGQKVLDKILNT
ncbi:MAG: hypothetical protein Q8Q54_04005 [Methylococcales bacterium]|nr:hypothetical protein [Methylococcales bacterium]MDP3838065.1 hypothetical protein [Methylococcales bacterium]